MADVTISSDTYGKGILNYNQISNTVAANGSLSAYQAGMVYGANYLNGQQAPQPTHFQNTSNLHVNPGASHNSNLPSVNNSFGWNNTYEINNPYASVIFGSNVLSYAGSGNIEPVDLTTHSGV